MFPRVRESKPKPRLRLPWRAIRQEPNPWPQDLGKRFPLDTQMQSLWRPAIQAQLALNKKNPAAALTALQAASPIELGQIAFISNISCLYHVYVRGEAYLASGQGSAAAAEFQKIICVAPQAMACGVTRRISYRSMCLRRRGCSISSCSPSPCDRH